MTAQRWRLTNTATDPAVSPALQTYTDNAPADVRRQLLSSDASALATVAYTPDGSDDPAAGDALHCQFVSADLGADLVYASGSTIKLAVQGLEDHANNNLFVQLYVAIVDSAGTTVRRVLRSKVLQAAELGTSLAGRFLSTTQDGADYTTVSGDRLVVEISLEGDPGGGGGVQGHNGSIRWGGAGAGGDLAESDGETGTTLNPWVEFDTTTPPSDQTANYGVAVETDTALAFGIILGAYAHEVMADSPFLYWRLNDPSGTVAEDQTANNRDGTYINTPTLGVAGLLTGDPNDAITLSSVGLERVERDATGVTNGSEFSMEAWVKGTTPQDDGVTLLMESRAAASGPITKVGITDDETGLLVFIRRDDGTTVVNNVVVPYNVCDNLPHHVVLTDKDNAGTRTWRLYVDGIQRGSGTYVRGTYTLQDAFNAGARESSGTAGNWYNGTIDEVATYTTELSAARVLAHYEAGANAQVVTYGVAAETDTALAFDATLGAGGQTANYGIAAETDSALAFTHSKLASYGIAAETSTALAFLADRRHAYGVAAETDSALAFVHEKLASYGIAAESDAALAAVASKLVQYGVALETDTALVFTGELGGGDQTEFYGVALETDTGLAFVHSKLAVYGIASETDSALAFSGVVGEQTVFYGVALGRESEEIYSDPYLDAGALPFITTLASGSQYGVAVETDTGLAFVHSKLATYGVAVETDSALAFTATKVQVVLYGVAVETDTALAFIHEKLAGYGVAVEADSALAFEATGPLPPQEVLYAIAIELDVALAFGAETARILEGFEVGHGPMGQGVNRRRKDFATGKGRAVS